MYIDGSDITRIIISPDQIQQILSAVNLIRIHCQKLKHIKFLRCKIDLTFPDENTASFAINLHIPFHKHRTAGRLFLAFRCSAHDCLDSCLHFENIERLCDIVVRAGLKADDLVGVLAAGADDDDGQVRPAAHPADDQPVGELSAGHGGHHDE